MIIRFLSNYKTTALLIFLLSSSAYFSNSALTTLHPNIKDGFGYAGIYFFSGEIYRIFSGALLTHGAEFYFRALIMILLCVGYLEYSYGSMKTFLGFWTIHILTLSIFSLLTYILYYIVGSDFFYNIYTLTDVGPSAGYIGCLGIIVALLKIRKQIVFSVLETILILILIFHLLQINSEKLIIADILHIIAFNLGFFGNIFLQKNITTLTPGE